MGVGMPGGGNEVVDSFLVWDGRAVGALRHRGRFARHVAALSSQPLNHVAARVAEFYSEGCAQIPRHGRWFPRLSCHVGAHGVEFAFQLRPAPALREHTRLYIPAIADPRQHPTIKGPDLPVLARLREEAAEAGADDAVLVRETGAAVGPGEAGAELEAAERAASGPGEAVVAEAANSAIVFYTPQGLVTAPKAWVLESVTVRASIDAGLIPQPTQQALPLAQALHTPALAASSLHGWTPVVAWEGIRWGIGKQGDAMRSTVQRGSRVAAPPLPKMAPSPRELNRRLWETAQDLAVLSG